MKSSIEMLRNRMNISFMLIIFVKVRLTGTILNHNPVNVEGCISKSCDHSPLSLLVLVFERGEHFLFLQSVVNGTLTTLSNLSLHHFAI